MPTEVERSFAPSRIAKAVRRLIAARARRKRLIVPQRHLDKAMGVAQGVAAGPLTITNMSGTRRRFVRRKTK